MPSFQVTNAGKKQFIAWTLMLLSRVIKLQRVYYSAQLHDSSRFCSLGW